MKDQDALFLENWLMDKWGCILKLFEVFEKETGWKKSRLNNAFSLVWRDSDKITW